MSTVEERFWSKVKKADGDGCWDWQGRRFRGLYGQFQMNGRPYGAHRAAWILARGEPEPGLVIRHLCGNHGCVRLDHLELGTKKENAVDTLRHGRLPQPYNPWMPLHRVADLLGITQATLRQQIKRGKLRAMMSATYHVQLREVERYRRDSQGR